MSNRTLGEIGLGNTPQTVIFLISLLPLVGLVIGASYSARRNAATRQFGRRLLLFAMALHVFYLACICPASFAFALNH
jgi:hypothetical protein